MGFPANISGTAGAQLVGHTLYPPPVNASVVYDATVGSPPIQAIDAAHLKVTFTLTATANILARLQAWQDVASPPGSQLWGFLESGVVVSGSCGVIDRSNSTGAMTSYTTYLPNIAAGSHTWVWGWSNATDMRLILGDGVTQDGGAHIWAPAVMEVWSV